MEDKLKPTMTLEKFLEIGQPIYDAKQFSQNDYDKMKSLLQSTFPERFINIQDVSNYSNSSIMGAFRRVYIKYHVESEGKKASYFPKIEEPEQKEMPRKKPIQLGLF